MRDRLRQHFPTVLAFAAVLTVAGGASLLAGTPAGLALAVGSALPREPIALPGPGEDRDRDSYADGLDATDGDLLLRLDLRAADARGAHPYVLAGTQDDHGRTGAGAELEWRHVVDHDPLGRRAGSPAWQRDALRTGAWVSTLPGEGLRRAAAEDGTLSGPEPGARWPQALLLNVRDDRPRPTAEVELWDERPDPDALLGRWTLAVDLPNGTWQSDASAPVPLGTAQRLPGPGGSLELAVEPALDLPHAEKAALAARWAPTLRFARGERFFPVPGDALQRFHGFYAQAPDLRTWDLAFNNGRDAYRLLLADFDGDRLVDHRDAALLTDVLAAGEVGRPTVYAHVLRSTGGAVVVQYWFLSFYNFVAGEGERDIAGLAHDGDREFVQLRFRDAEAARNGTPDSIAFSQHYLGLRVTDPGALLDGTAWSVYVAHGSHASYPVPGDDRRHRPALSGYHDRFDGEGVAWTPGNYTVEVLGDQAWHMGHLWGPQTRHSRDLGTSARPLLNHDFRYPYVDPLLWEEGLAAVTAAAAEALYGRPA